MSYKELKGYKSLQVTKLSFYYHLNGTYWFSNKM